MCARLLNRCMNGKSDKASETQSTCVFKKKSSENKHRSENEHEKIKQEAQSQMQRQRKRHN